MIQIGNSDVIKMLKKYAEEYISEINKCGYFFVNPNATSISDQAIRRMIKKYCSLSSIDLHITPHMFRHTFATRCFESQVPPKTVQHYLGHATLQMTMDLYTHVLSNMEQESMAKLENTLDGVFDAGDSFAEEQFNRKIKSQQKVVQFGSVV